MRYNNLYRGEGDEAEDPEEAVLHGGVVQDYVGQVGWQQTVHTTFRQYNFWEKSNSENKKTNGK